MVVVALHFSNLKVASAAVCCLCSFRSDPDILVGYEVQMHSWGYLLQRAAALGVDLCQQLSRVPGRKYCRQRVHVKLQQVLCSGLIYECKRWECLATNVELL